MTRESDGLQRRDGYVPPFGRFQSAQSLIRNTYVLDRELQGIHTQKRLFTTNAASPMNKIRTRLCAEARRSCLRYVVVKELDAQPTEYSRAAGSTKLTVE